jgi:hypothetical protein
VITAASVLTTQGNLVVDLIDPATGKAIWRGIARETMGDPSLEKVLRQIDKPTRKMFKRFPPE